MFIDLIACRACTEAECYLRISLTCLVPHFVANNLRLIIFNRRNPAIMFFT